MTLLNSIILLDIKIQKVILYLRSEVWDNFFFFITKLGSWPVIIVIFICLSVWLFATKKSRLFFPFFITVVGSGIMTLIIKYLINRERPEAGIALYLEKLPSFPSAHASLVFALFGFIIYVIWRLNFNLIFKIILSLVFIALIILVGFSRIYLGVHFTSDVIGGYFTGLFCLLIVIYISRNKI
jgi:membrane-associated phospholipid phosphatase